MFVCVVRVPWEGGRLLRVHAFCDPARLAFVVGARALWLQLCSTTQVASSNCELYKLYVCVSTCVCFCPHVTRMARTLCVGQTCLLFTLGVRFNSEGLQIGLCAYLGQFKLDVVLKM